MLFRKYQIVFFRDNIGLCRKIQCRGWLFALGFLVFLGAVGTNVVLYQYYTRYHVAERELADTIKASQAQKEQLLSLASKIRTLEGDISRIQNFDAKLRVMIDLDPAPAENLSAVGGASSREFVENYLPLHKNELLAKKMHGFLEQLETEARLEEVHQQELAEALRQKRDILSATPSIWPTEGWVTSRFGKRKSPFTGRLEFHKGLDISAPSGTPIFATARGKVVQADRDGGYGKTIIIDHGHGIRTVYSHLSKFAVQKGVEIQRGELIGYVGNTGRSTGSHLHYEVRLNNIPIDPEKYILN
ncbi:MAG: peptidase M24 [Deltaproteobacteria bacterium]|nr:peptidase M24 [Deltaproteobacteria bacterium]